MIVMLYCELEFGNLTLKESRKKNTKALRSRSCQPIIFIDIYTIVSDKHVRT